MPQRKSQTAFYSDCKHRLSTFSVQLETGSSQLACMISGPQLNSLELVRVPVRVGVSVNVRIEARVRVRVRVRV